jgi:hypothetical protein
MPSLSPKEHREMKMQMELLELQERRYQEDKEWRQRREQKAERRHIQQLIVMGGIVTVMLLIGQLLAAFIPPWFGKNP